MTPARGTQARAILREIANRRYCWRTVCRKHNVKMGAEYLEMSVALWAAIQAARDWERKQMDAIQHETFPGVDPVQPLNGGVGWSKP
jgi:DNA-binding HxlR family transcriptional regulator